MIAGLVAALGAAVAFGVAAVLQAQSARRTHAGAGVDPRLLLRLLRRPEFVVALALNLLGFLLHFLALRTLPLFLVQAVIASSVAVTALLAVRLLDAVLRAVEWAAVVAVCGGLAVLAASAEATGVPAPQAPGPFLAAAVLVVAALGVLAARAPGVVGAALLGASAGLGFAVVAVSSRLLDGYSPAELARDPASWSLLAGGVLGFLFYATALQRGSVTMTSAALVLTQTAVPAAVGVLALGDGVRPGWSVAAALALALGVAGAVALARFAEAGTQAEAGVATDPHAVGPLG